MVVTRRRSIAAESQSSSSEPPLPPPPPFKKKRKIENNSNINSIPEKIHKPSHGPASSQKLSKATIKMALIPKAPQTMSKNSGNSKSSKIDNLKAARDVVRRSSRHTPSQTIEPAAIQTIEPSLPIKKGAVLKLNSKIEKQRKTFSLKAKEPMALTSKSDSSKKLISKVVLKSPLPVDSEKKGPLKIRLSLSSSKIPHVPEISSPTTIKIPKMLSKTSQSKPQVLPKPDPLKLKLISKRDSFRNSIKAKASSKLENLGISRASQPDYSKISEAGKVDALKATKIGSSILGDRLARQKAFLDRHESSLNRPLKISFKLQQHEKRDSSEAKKCREQDLPLELFENVSAMNERLVGLLREERDHKRNRLALFEVLPDPIQFPDYYRIIREPLSVTEIRTKASSLQNALSLRHLYDIMFDNALYYNEPNSELHADAAYLKSKVAVYLERRLAVRHPKKGASQSVGKRSESDERPPFKKSRLEGEKETAQEESLLHVRHYSKIGRGEVQRLFKLLEVGDEDGVIEVLHRHRGSQVTTACFESDFLDREQVNRNGIGNEDKIENEIGIESEIDSDHENDDCLDKKHDSMIDQENGLEQVEKERAKVTEEFSSSHPVPATPSARRPRKKKVQVGICHVAAYYGRCAVLSFLYQHLGQDLGQRDWSFESTVLGWAVFGGQYDAARWLISRGADIHVLNGVGMALSALLETGIAKIQDGTPEKLQWDALLSGNEDRWSILRAALPTEPLLQAYTCWSGDTSLDAIREASSWSDGVSLLVRLIGSAARSSDPEIRAAGERIAAATNSAVGIDFLQGIDKKDEELLNPELASDPATTDWPLKTDHNRLPVSGTDRGFSSLSYNRGLDENTSTVVSNRSGLLSLPALGGRFLRKATAPCGAQIVPGDFVLFFKSNINDGVINDKDLNANNSTDSSVSSLRALSRLLPHSLEKLSPIEAYLRTFSDLRILHVQQIRILPVSSDANRVTAAGPSGNLIGSSHVRPEAVVLVGVPYVFPWETVHIPEKRFLSHEVFRYKPLVPKGQHPWAHTNIAAVISKCQVIPFSPDLGNRKMPHINQEKIQDQIAPNQPNDGPNKVDPKMNQQANKMLTFVCEFKYSELTKNFLVLKDKGRQELVTAASDQDVNLSHLSVELEKLMAVHDAVYEQSRASIRFVSFANEKSTTSGSSSANFNVNSSGIAFGKSLLNVHGNSSGNLYGKFIPNANNYSNWIPNAHLQGNMGHASVMGHRAPSPGLPFLQPAASSSFYYQQAPLKHGPSTLNYNSTLPSLSMNKAAAFPSALNNSSVPSALNPSAPSPAFPVGPHPRFANWLSFSFRCARFSFSFLPHLFNQDTSALENSPSASTLMLPRSQEALTFRLALPMDATSLLAFLNKQSIPVEAAPAEEEEHGEDVSESEPLVQHPISDSAPRRRGRPRKKAPSTFATFQGALKKLPRGFSAFEVFLNDGSELFALPTILIFNPL